MAIERGTVWVTRTEPGASRLAARLDSVGYRVLNQPLLRIEGCPEPELRSLARNAGSFDLIIVVAAHAANFAMPMILDQGGGKAPDAPRWLAVGEQTAEALIA